VLGPGRWWPGRLGDEDTRMPGPGPEVVGSSRVAFVRESLPRRASLDRVQGERGPVVVGPVRVGVRCWCRGGPGPWLAVRWAASPFRVNQAARAEVVLPAGQVDRASPGDEASSRARRPGRRVAPAGPAGSLPGRGARGRCGSSRADGESWLPAPGPGTEVSRPRS
jgi:hypothetical protein